MKNSIDGMIVIKGRLSRHGIARVSTMLRALAKLESLEGVIGDVLAGRVACTCVWHWLCEAMEKRGDECG